MSKRQELSQCQCGMKLPPLHKVVCSGTEVAPYTSTVVCVGCGFVATGISSSADKAIELAMMSWNACMADPDPVEEEVGR